MRLRSNGALTNVDGLSNLTNIDGLASLTHVGGGLYISENTDLCESLVDAFVDAMEARGWSGLAHTYGNADC